MSRLSNLRKKTETIEIGGETIILKPLGIEHLDLVLDLENPSTRPKALKQLLKISLQNAIPDATDEEIQQVGVEHFKTILEGIVKVNGLNDKKQSSQSPE